MARLSQRDFRSFLSFLQGIYSVHDLSKLQARILSGLRKLVPSEVSAYNEVDQCRRHDLLAYDRRAWTGFVDGREIFHRPTPECKVRR